MPQDVFARPRPHDVVEACARRVEIGEHEFLGCRIGLGGATRGFEIRAALLEQRDMPPVGHHRRIAQPILTGQAMRNCPTEDVEAFRTQRADVNGHCFARD